MSRQQPAEGDQQQKRRDFYLETLRARYAAMTPRQRRRLHRADSIVEISLRHLVDEDLLPPPDEHGQPQSDRPEKR